MPLGNKVCCVNIQLYVSGVVVLGGQSIHFYINVNLGGIDITLNGQNNIMHN